MASAESKKYIEEVLYLHLVSGFPVPFPLNHTPPIPPADHKTALHPPKTGAYCIHVSEYSPLKPSALFHLKEYHSPLHAEFPS